MSDYISREAALEAFENADADVREDYRYGACDWGFGMKNIQKVLNSVPTADVEPVRHCKWLRNDYDWHSLTTYRCTACGEEFCFEIDEDLPLLNYNYCPNCGAKMDLEDDNGT